MGDTMPPKAIAVWIGASILFIGIYFYAKGNSDPVQPRPKTTWNIGPGFVRQIYIGNYPNIIFETDEGNIYSFGLCRYPEYLQLYKGMHATLYMDGCLLQYAQHLPPDVQYPPEVKK